MPEKAYKRLSMSVMTSSGRRLPRIQVLRHQGLARTVLKGSVLSFFKWGNLADEGGSDYTNSLFGKFNAQMTKAIGVEGRSSRTGTST